MTRSRVEKVIMEAVEKALGADDMTLVTRIAARLTSERIVEQTVKNAMEQTVKNAMEQAVKDASDRDIEAAARFVERGRSRPSR